MMKTIVLKFGGTSVGSTDRISAVADLIKTACEVFLIYQFSKESKSI